MHLYRMLMAILLIGLMDMFGKSGFSAGWWSKHHHQITWLGGCLKLVCLHIQQQLILIIKMLTARIRKLVSSKKFYDIVKEKKDRIMPKTAEELIISKYLKDNVTYSRKDPEAQSKPTQKNNQKSINYDQYLRENSSGSIIQREYKDINLHLLSLNYQNISLPEIYSICQKVSPDLIFLQARPQPYIKDFQLLPKVSNTFSDIKYLDQLCLTPRTVKSSILTPPLIEKLENMLGQTSSSRHTNKKVLINDNKDLVEDDVVMMASYYASSKRSALLFAELPEQPWREWLCNSHTLMELQELFKHVTKNVPFYESLRLSPYRLAALIRPHTFLSMRDKYMATLIEMAVASQKYKKILCILGIAQNQAIEQILLSQSLLREDEGKKEFTPIIQYLIGPEIKHSLLRNIQGWEIIEKHIILDVLQHGQSVLSQPIEAFTTTNKVIQNYGTLLNEYSEQAILQFRYDKTTMYVELMRKQMAQGAELKKKFMLREALRAASSEL